MPSAAGEISVAITRALVSSASVIAMAPEPVPMSRIVSAAMFQRGFDQVFGFGPRDQHVRRHAKFAAVEFLRAGDVLRRLALHAARADSGRSGSTPPRAVPARNARRDRRVAADGVGQQHFGGQARRGNAGVFEKFRALEQRGPEGHC